MENGNFACSVASLFNQIPPVVWSGFLAAACTATITVIGIHLTNRANDKRLERQLQADRRAKKLDREMNMKREIYLTATEAIHEAMSAIGKMANLDIPIGSLLNSYSEKSSAISKSHIVASNSTIEALTNLTQEIATSFLRLAPLRIQLDALKIEKDSWQEIMTESGSKTGMWVDKMQQHNLNAIADQHIFEILHERYETESGRNKAAIKQFEKLNSELGLQQLQVTEESMREVLRTQHLLANTLFAVRSELGMPLDKDWYRNLVGKSIAAQQAALDDFLKNLSATIQSFTTAEPTPVSEEAK